MKKSTANTKAATQVANTPEQAAPQAQQAPQSTAPATTVATASEAATASTEASEPQTQQAQAATAERPNILVFKMTRTGRYYVYYKGVDPEHNVGCGCTTARKAMRYMRMLKSRDNATIDITSWAKLQEIAATEHPTSLS